LSGSRVLVVVVEVVELDRAGSFLLLEAVELGRVG
jgi:hypothetical protein